MLVVKRGVITLIYKGTLTLQSLITKECQRCSCAVCVGAAHPVIRAYSIWLVSPAKTGLYLY